MINTNYITGTDKSQLKISRLQEGSYVFTLKVVDQSEHSDEARVKVLVLPEKNTPPVARAGDDKVLNISIRSNDRTYLEL